MITSLLGFGGGVFSLSLFKVSAFDFFFLGKFLTSFLACSVSM